MSNFPVHCPLCNTKNVTGLGLVVYEQSALVEYRCRGCGEIFFQSDKRGRELVQVAEQKAAGNAYVPGIEINKP